jgi:cellulose synthase/poly-beta-1,6-N-acetylglucosamine synthase-like glycosyltransferase
MKEPDVQQRTETPPLVSVITNSYNCASYLRANIESVLSQDYENWQHIVIDAGSTDGSMAILRGMQHPRLKVNSLPFWMPMMQPCPGGCRRKCSALSMRPTLSWLAAA